MENKAMTIKTRITIIPKTSRDQKLGLIFHLQRIYQNHIFDKYETTLYINAKAGTNAKLYLAIPTNKKP